MQKLKKKFDTFGSMNRHTIKSIFTAKNFTKEKPAKKIFSQNPGNLGKIVRPANQTSEEKFITLKPETTPPLWDKYRERSLPIVPSEYGDTGEFSFIDEDIGTLDLGNSTYDEIYESAPTDNESHSTKSSINDSGIDNISVPESAILRIDGQNEINSTDRVVDTDSKNTIAPVSNKSRLARETDINGSRSAFDRLIENLGRQSKTEKVPGLTVDTASKTDDFNGFTGVSNVLDEPRNASNSFHSTDDENSQIARIYERQKAIELQKDDWINSVSGRNESDAVKEAVVKRPAPQEVFETMHSLGSLKSYESIHNKDVNSISTKERNKSLVESVTTNTQSQHSSPSGTATKGVHPQQSRISFTSVNDEQVENTLSGVKAFVPTFGDKHENRKSETIYLEPWDLKPIPELDECEYFDCIGSPHERKVVDNKSEHVYAQVKRNDNVRSSPFDLEDAPVTADISSTTTPKLHLKKHTVDVSFPKTQHKTITETLLGTEKTLSHEEENHKTVPNKSWSKRISDKIREMFSRGYAALHFIFVRFTKDQRKSVDYGASLDNENGRLNRIKEILSERRMPHEKRTETLNAIKEALSQKHILTANKPGELGKIREVLSQKYIPTADKPGGLAEIKKVFFQKHTLVPGKVGELGKIREALSEKLPLLQNNTTGLSKLKEALSEKGFRVDPTNYERNRAQNNLCRDGYAFNISTEHDRAKSILTAERDIVAKLRESGMKEEQGGTCVPSLGCSSHTRSQAPRAV